MIYVKLFEVSFKMEKNLIINLMFLDSLGLRKF